MGGASINVGYWLHVTAPPGGKANNASPLLWRTEPKAKILQSLDPGHSRLLTSSFYIEFCNEHVAYLSWNSNKDVPCRTFDSNDSGPATSNVHSSVPD